MSLAPLSLTMFAGSGLGLLVSQLNNYIFGLALAGGILLAVLSASFINMTEASDVIPPAEQEQVSDALENNAQLVSATQLEDLLDAQPDEIQEEIIQINSDAGNLSLQVAMLVPIIACLLGLLNSFRMMRLPDFNPSAAAEGLVGG